jgi:GNAT superfamily N-acetyltransferase
VEITRVDPLEAQGIRAFHDIYCAVGAADAPETFVAAPVEEIRAVLAAPTARFEYTGFLGLEHGRPVASGWAAGFLKENTDHGFVLPRVLPTERRHGYGSQMLTCLEDHARRDGRSALNAQSRWASKFGPSGVGSATIAFVERHGFQLGLVQTIRRLDLPMSPDRAAVIAKEVAARSQDYTIRSWLGPVPEEFLGEWAAMDAAVSTEAPTGELDLDAEVASPEAIRDDERILAASGQTSVGAVAVDRDGQIVAYSEMVVQIDASVPARQGGTLVKQSHRGHRLGVTVQPVRAGGARGSAVGGVRR